MPDQTEPLPLRLEASYMTEICDVCVLELQIARRSNMEVFQILYII